MLANLTENARNVVKMLIAILVFALCIMLYMHSEEIGAGVGALGGKTVGLALGSYDGVTKGISAGTQEGKAMGLSAADTEGEMVSKVKELGNLRVLVANVDISNYHELGSKYAALYLFRGSAIFSVDLTKADMMRNNAGEVVIMLPEPTAKVLINDSETELVKDYQRRFFNGSSEDGFEAYLNTLRMIDNISLEEVSNYEALLTMARDSARNQVRRVTESVCVDCKSITVDFRSENLGD